MKELLEVWQRKNGGQLPTKVVVYRDGVSEGQYQQVLTEEYGGMCEAIEVVYREKKKPEVTILVCDSVLSKTSDLLIKQQVVQKRHHTRFCPNGSDSLHTLNKNCRPGTVVDRGITGGGRQLFDFFMIAHQTLGSTTACPAHYTVIKSETEDMTADDIQRATYALCHMWQRAPRAVSYAPPAYYADLLAERGRMYLYDVMCPEESGDFVSGPDTWNGGVNSKLFDTMFWV